MYTAANLRESVVGSAEIASGYGFSDAVAAAGEMRVDWQGDAPPFPPASASQIHDPHSIVRRSDALRASTFPPRCWGMK